MRIAAYLKARLEERSTWGGIGAAIVGGSALPMPFNWLAIGAGVVAALVPTTGKS
jgi:hypothetical protein